jgi:hypothetical protein
MISMKYYLQGYLKHKGSIVPNVPTLGAVADLEPETVNLALSLIRNENFILTEKPAIEPNVC